MHIFDTIPLIHGDIGELQITGGFRVILVALNCFHITVYSM